MTTAVACEAGAAASNSAVLVPPTTSPEEAALKSSPETVTAAPPTVSVVCPTTTELAPCRVAVKVSPPAVTIAVCTAACEATSAAAKPTVLEPTTSPEDAALKTWPETVTAAPPAVSVEDLTTTTLPEACRLAVKICPPAVTTAVCTAAWEATGTAAKPTVLVPTTSPEDAALMTCPEIVIAAPPAVSVELPTTTTVPEPCRAAVKVCPPAVTTAVCAAAEVWLAGAAVKAIVLVPPTTIADVPTLPTWPLTVKLWPDV